MFLNILHINYVLKFTIVQKQKNLKNNVFKCNTITSLLIQNSNTFINLSDKHLRYLF